jgi:hypothetical protein
MGKQKCRAFAALLGDSAIGAALSATMLHFDNAKGARPYDHTIYFLYLRQDIHRFAAQGLAPNRPRQPCKAQSPKRKGRAFRHGLR